MSPALALPPNSRYHSRLAFAALSRLPPSIPPSVSPSAPDSRPETASARVLAWLWTQRWLLCIFLGALAVRLHWNLEVHPLGDYVYSDMNGYVQRAERMLRDFSKPHEYSAFFPFATHWMVAGILWLFDELDPAISIWYALMGATTVAMAYAIARRVSPFPIVAPAVGLIGILYYPHFSNGGYILSETPFCLCLTGAVLAVVRMADHGRRRDALLLGLFAGVGALFRPQILLSAAFVGIYWIIRRKALPNIKFKHLLISAIPLAMCLGLGVVHLHHHTERWGLISENGSFNLVMGRCHNSKIESLPDGKGHGKVHFRPPPLLQVVNAETAARRAGVEPGMRMNAAFGDTFSYKGYIGDKKQHHEYIRRCIQKTGWGQQLAYSWDNMSLLWFHNIPWPDSGPKQWRPVAQWWNDQVLYWLMVPSWLGLFWVLVPGRRAAKRGLLSVQILALMLQSAIFFGGTRFRMPYDFVLIVLAVESYALVGWAAWTLLQRRRQSAADSASGSGKSAQKSVSS